MSETAPPSAPLTSPWPRRWHWLAPVRLSLGTSLGGVKPGHEIRTNDVARASRAPASAGCQAARFGVRCIIRKRQTHERPHQDRPRAHGGPCSVVPYFQQSDWNSYPDPQLSCSDRQQASHWRAGLRKGCYFKTGKSVPTNRRIGAATRRHWPNERTARLARCPLTPGGPEGRCGPHPDRPISTAIGGVSRRIQIDGPWKVPSFLSIGYGALARGAGVRA